MMAREKTLMFKQNMSPLKFDPPREIYPYMALNQQFVVMTCLGLCYDSTKLIQPNINK